METLRRLIFAVIILVLAALLFFGVGLFQLRTPGLMYDEAADAVPAMELIFGQTPSIARSVSRASNPNR